MVTFSGLERYDHSPLPLSVDWPRRSAAPVLAPYDTLEIFLAEVKDWFIGQGYRCSMGQQGVAVEVRTDSGSLRTIDYPVSCLSPSSETAD